MDFIGDEDSTRYALELAFREHVRDTQAAGVPLDSLPHAGVARTFLAELERRGWRLARTAGAALCVECGEPSAAHEHGFGGLGCPTGGTYFKERL